LDLNDNLEKILYLKENKEEYFTTQHRYLLNHPQLLQEGKRYFTVIYEDTITKEDFSDYKNKYDQYLVFCYYDTTVPKESRKWLNNEKLLGNLYDYYTLETIYDFTADLKYKGAHPKYFENQVDLLYLLKTYKHTYNDNNFIIYKIN
jgi:hypothetical protein